MNVNVVIRASFVALFLLELVWVAYLVALELAEGGIGYLGYAYPLSLMYFAAPLLLLFLVYELLSIRRSRAGREVDYARRSRYLAILVLTANLAYVLYPRSLILS